MKIVIKSSWNSHSVSSTYASIRRRTNPTATPTRTSPLRMPAIWKISPAALQVEEAAPPLLPLDGYFNELTTFAKHCSVHTGSPNDVTLFWAFNPPKWFTPLMKFTLLSLLLLLPTLELPTTVIVAGVAALAMAILSEIRKHCQKWRNGKLVRHPWIYIYWRLLEQYKQEKVRQVCNSASDMSKPTFGVEAAMAFLCPVVWFLK